MGGARARGSVVGVAGGLREALSLLRSTGEVGLLAASVAVPVAYDVACWWLGRDPGLSDVALWVATVTAVTLLAVRRHVEFVSPLDGAARRNLRRLREREEGRGATLLEVVVGGERVAVATVLAPGGIPRPARRAENLVCPIHVVERDRDGTVREGVRVVALSPEGRVPLTLLVRGMPRTFVVDVAAGLRVDLGGPAAAPPPRGTARALAELAGEDLDTEAGVARAKRRAAKRLHPDRPGGDEAALKEVNATLDARLADLRR